MDATEIVRQRRRRLSRPGWLARAAQILLLLLAVCAAGVAAAVALGSAAVLSFTRDMPAIEQLAALPARQARATQPSYLYAGIPAPDGAAPEWVLVDEIRDPAILGTGWQALDALPTSLADAVVALEDPDFRTAHAPVLTAALDDLLRGDLTSQALSPLAIEVVKRHLRADAASDADDQRRVLQDWLLGWQIERNYSRDVLLEWALNTRYYGNLAYGVEAAARLYFGKPATDLSPGEAALLAAVSRQPEANPFDDPVAARAALRRAIYALVSQGYWSEAQGDVALEAGVQTAAPPGRDSLAPAFSALVRRELEALLGPERLLAGGLTVETTLDTELQYQASCASETLLVGVGGSDEAAGGRPECVTARFLDDTASQTPGGVDDMSLVALQPQTGEILAYVGGGQAEGSPPGLPRHPAGTMIRPLIYLTALSQGYSAAALLHDIPSGPLSEGERVDPVGLDAYRGPLRLRQALAGDAAAPAAELLDRVGTGAVDAIGRGLGLPELAGPTVLDPTGWASSRAEVSLLDLSQALAILANRGEAAGRPLEGTISPDLPRPATIARVQDAAGDELYRYAPVTRPLVAPELAYLMADILADGEARCQDRACAGWERLPDGRPAAIMSGESAATGDYWTIGATPQIVVGVWGASAAGEPETGALWQAVQRFATEDTPIARRQPPAGLLRQDVCAVSGLLPRYGPGGSAHCPTITELFVPGTEPLADDTMVQDIAINRETGRLATIFTPPQLVERQIYVVYPPELDEWAAARGIEQPPEQYDSVQRVRQRVGDSAAIVSPESWTTVSGQIAVMGTAAGEGFDGYRLAVFPGLMPDGVAPIVERSSEMVIDGLLGTWDTTSVDDGLYTLLLTVFEADGRFAEVAIPVTVASEQ